MSTYYDYSAHSKEENFERTCIRVLHRVWFPHSSFAQLERLFYMDNPTEVINYEWYSKRVSFMNARCPELTFKKLNTPWALNLHEILMKDIRKQDVYKSWEEQPSDGFAFPLIGTQGILFETCVPPEFDCVLKRIDSGYTVIALLKDYATMFKEPVFDGEEY